MKRLFIVYEVLIAVDDIEDVSSDKAHHKAIKLMEKYHPFDETDEVLGVQTATFWNEPPTIEEVRNDEA